MVFPILLDTEIFKIYRALDIDYLYYMEDYSPQNQQI